jgi:hypothetical protein
LAPSLELDGPNRQRLIVDTDVYLAADAPLRATVFASVSFALTLDAGAVDQEVQRARSAAVGDRHILLTLAAAQGAEVWYAPVHPTSLRRLCTNPAVCLSGMPNSTIMVRQVWIAASPKLGSRPRFPIGSSLHTMSGSNHTVSEPRRFSASL